MLGTILNLNVETSSNRSLMTPVRNQLQIIDGSSKITDRNCQRRLCMEQEER